MKPQKMISELFRLLVTFICIVSLIPTDGFGAVSQAPSSGDQAVKVPPDQLDSLVAPIALYPDPVLAQTLAASTYPLEVMQLQQWLEKHKNLKDKALADAAAKEPWDPSVQALAALPEVVKRLADDIQWTTDLGNAFLAQQNDVMDAVQRMRKKAEEKGTLKSSEQLKVETQTLDNKSVIVIEPANPQVVYVPSYDPVVVYGSPVYPYPPIYYPPPGYYAAGMALSFGVGVAMGAWWGGGGGWGWNCGWGGNNVYVNHNNFFNRNTNINGGNRTNIGNGNRNNIGGGNRNLGGNRASTLPAGRGNLGNNWQHNPQHRGGAPYRDRATADRFGGPSRGDSLTNRQTNARQQLRQQGGNLPSNRAGRGGADNRVGGGSVGNRGGAGGGGADRIGNRNLSGGGGRNRDAFGSAGGYNGSNARANSNRGASSMGSRGGGGGSRGGFGGGGGRRGGGGGRGRR